jgi:beta-galactosidase GanA
MDLLDANGISVDLATPTAAPPAWLAQAHPEALPVAEDGHVSGFGNRLRFDPTSMVYRDRAARITRALAERYSAHDSVLFFQWRASRGGHERFHSAMLPHSGTAARTWHEVAELGNELPRIAAPAGSRSGARIALYFDWNAWWGLTTGNQVAGPVTLSPLAVAVVAYRR